MDKSKSQHYNFCYEALPALFHSQTDRFMEMLEKDGLKFIKFWWDYVAPQIPEDKLSSFEGMAYKIEKVGKATKLPGCGCPTGGLCAWHAARRMMILRMALNWAI
jgi:hypothetical protein